MCPAVTQLPPPAPTCPPEPRLSPGPSPKSGRRGRTLPIVATVLSVVVGVAVVAGLVALSRAGTKTVTALQVGDCVTTLDESGDVSHLPVVACGQAHQGEVYFAYQMPAGEFPGDEKVQKQAEARCAEEIDTYAGAGAVEKYDIFYLRPSSGDWPAHRGVTCIATDARKPVTGSIRK